jgi:hypothetical protein
MPAAGLVPNDNVKHRASELPHGATAPFQMVVERGSHAAILARKMEVEHGVDLSSGSGDSCCNAG